jgi:uncharacterized protein
MKTLMTPGVHVAEATAFPNSVTEVSTSIPAFVGWTERAQNNSQSLRGVPFRIASLAEFHHHFGGAPTAEHVRFTLKPAHTAALESRSTQALFARDAAPFQVGTNLHQLTQVGGKYLLYFALSHFFMNGGSACYVVSVGEYGAPVDMVSLESGLSALSSESEPSVLVVPDAVLLSQRECYEFQSQAISHCAKTRNRFAILDVWEGYRARDDLPDVIDAFRNGIRGDTLSFGAAYYPWLKTNVVQSSELSFRNFADESSFATLIDAIKGEPTYAQSNAAARREIDALLAPIADTQSDADVAERDRKLRTLSPLYSALCAEMANRLSLLPPSASVAGAYATVNRTHGVWKVAANVSLHGVMGTAVEISNQTQDQLNVTPSGKSINAIRTFADKGVLVWGARTLDGNGLDWRYVNVRRTMMMIETSIRVGLNAFVFEPNTDATWATLAAWADNYLMGLWTRGALAGATPRDAFSVSVGLGRTMTERDVAEGILRVTLLVAMIRPAEFIEITIEQKQQPR